MCERSYYSKLHEKYIKLHLRKLTGKTNLHVCWTPEKGKLLRVSTGTESKKEGELFMTRLDPDEYEIKNLKDTAAEVLDATAEATKLVSEAFKDFIKYQTNVKKAKKSTVKHHRTMINEFSRYASSLEPPFDFDSLPLDFFCVDPILEPRKAQEVKKLIEGFFATKSHESARKYRNSLSSFYTYLVAHSITRNHLLRFELQDIPFIVRYKATSTDSEFFTIPELNQLTAGLGLDTSYAYIQHDLLKDIYLLTSMTGLREQEIIFLKWIDIHFDGPEKSYLTVQRDSLTDFDTKSRLHRRIDLPSKAYSILWKRYVERTALLDSLKEQEKQKAPPYVFYTHAFLKWRQLKEHALSMKTTNVCRSIFGEETGKSFHSLRHTFATNLSKAGVSTKTIQMLMGHASITTTEKYIHTSSSERQNAAKLLNRHLERNAESESPVEQLRLIYSDLST